MDSPFHPSSTSPIGVSSLPMTTSICDATHLPSSTPLPNGDGISKPSSKPFHIATPLPTSAISLPASDVNMPTMDKKSNGQEGAVPPTRKKGTPSVQSTSIQPPTSVIRVNNNTSSSIDRITTNKITTSVTTSNPIKPLSTSSPLTSSSHSKSSSSCEWFHILLWMSCEDEDDEWW